MALEGTIKDFGLPDIFQLIGLQRKTGMLTLRNEKETVSVGFENGMVVSSDSSAKRLEDRLGNVLVKQGKLGKEKLDEALQTQKATLQRLGHILTANNYITEKDLKEALHIQVSQIVFKLFRWRDGEYHFAPTETVEYDRDYFNPLSADFILMEGIRMVDEWPIIEKKIPSMDLVLRPAVDTNLIEVVPADEAGAPVGLPADAKRGASSNKIRLTPQEEQIFRKVDGTRTVQAIIDSTGLNEFETCRTLFDLLNRNLITTVGRGTAREVEPGLTEAAPARSGYAAAVVVALVALAGIFVRYREPFGVTGLPSLLPATFHLILGDVSQSRLHRLDRGVLAYHLVHGSLPRTLEQVANEGLVDHSYLKDPWARPFHYALTEQGYLLSAVDDAGRKLSDTLIDRAVAGDKP